ncbi:MAG: hypothetical protein EBZ48_18005, partial [Proteobacteria bacterium]|nr:hypothetical protein [Pseudomonadota bacterium]
AEGRCPVTNPTARQIVGLLQTTRECDADAIAAQLALESATIESALLELELMGAIDRLPGNRLRLVHLNLA